MSTPYIYFLLLDFLLVVIGMILIHQSVNPLPVLIDQPAPRPRRQHYDRIGLEVDKDIYKRVFDRKQQGYDLVHWGDNKVIMVKELD